MARSRIEAVDLRVSQALAPLRDRWPVKAAGFVSEIADQPPLITLCAATMGAGLVLGDRRLANAGGRMLASELVATLLKGVVKARVDRTRPDAVAEGTPHRLEPGTSDAHEETSFPSGHTAGAVAVARAVSRSYPDHALGASLAATAIALVQLPRAKHYPSDVVAGAAIGLLADALVAGAERLVARAALA